MDEDNDSEKTEEPSARRIEEFRQRGEVASSKELNSVLILSACILTIGLSMTFVFEQITIYFEWISNVDYEKTFREDLFKKFVETHETATAVSIGCQWLNLPLFRQI